MSHESPYSYPTGEPILVGDQVRIRRTAGSRLLELLRSGGLPVSKWIGEITYVYDPSKPSPPWGDNDHGFSIKLPNGNELFGANTDDIELVSRAATGPTHQAEQGGGGQAATRSEST